MWVFLTPNKRKKSIFIHKSIFKDNDDMLYDLFIFIRFFVNQRPSTAPALSMLCSNYSKMILTLKNLTIKLFFANPFQSLNGKILDIH